MDSYDDLARKLTPHLKEILDPKKLFQEADLPKFTLIHLIGKTIEQIITTNNPLRNADPKDLTLIEYADGSYSVHMQAYHPAPLLHSFLIEGDSIKYSNRLYDASENPYNVALEERCEEIRRQLKHSKQNT